MWKTSCAQDRPVSAARIVQSILEYGCSPARPLQPILPVVSPHSRWSRSGFSLIELLIVITMIGVLVGVSYPRVARTIDREAVRGARREVVTQVARARTIASQRGCRSTVHFDAATDRVWVTACPISGTGAAVTVGTVSQLSGRYRVDFAASAASLDFLPTGLGIGTTGITLGFTRGEASAALTVSSVGRASW